MSAPRRGSIALTAGLARVLTRCSHALYLAGRMCEERSTLPLRLHLLRARGGRYTLGTFRLPPGAAFTYVDARSATDQIREIFFEEIYAVAGLSAAPRIIDCGGNIGLSVLWFKQRYPAAIITVYEADPAIAAVLERNLQTWGYMDVSVVRAAVSDHAGEIHFARDGADAGYVSSGPGLAVPAARLSERITEPLDILKLDIEGGEYAVIQDLCATGTVRLIRHIMLEIHCDTDTREDFAHLWLALTRAGFRLAVRAAFQGSPEREGITTETPFPGVASTRFYMLAYAWQP